MDDSPDDRLATGRDERASAEIAAMQRLWTPWRMRYVGGETKAQGCIFCDRLADRDDVDSLILLRGEQSFVIMNRYPYNTGHVMLVPNAHVPDPEAAAPAALAEMATLLPVVTRALRRVLRCDGFNVGMNVGEIAGAGVATHVHQHVVPRWLGDANFMPILASTMVLPELLPITYAKLRAQLSREATGTLSPATDVALVVLGRDDAQVLVRVEGAGGRLPRARPRDDEPVWRAAFDSVAPIVDGGAEVAGWAGAATATRNEFVALTLRAAAPSVAVEHRARWRFEAIGDALHATMDDADRVVVRQAMAQLAPRVGDG